MQLRNISIIISFKVNITYLYTLNCALDRVIQKSTTASKMARIFDVIVDVEELIIKLV